MDHPKYMKISDLSKASDTPRSTIWHYIRAGMLPPAIKTGQTMSYYEEKHVKRLQLIKKLREEERLPLKFITEIIEEEEGNGESKRTSHGRGSSRKEIIIEAAIALFREKGYDNTSITDIVDRARIGRGTFYMNFANKEELFIECADRIFFAMYEDVWQEIKNEKNMVERLKKRGVAFLRSYSQWSDMMNLIRGASVGNHPTFSKKLSKVMHQIIDPLIHDIQRGMEQGLIRKIDPKIAGFVLMGMSEYLSYLIYEDNSYNQDDFPKIIETFFDMLNYSPNK
jgi:AcrR family transcriptional regulator/predicted DNA-binding transcriptional regulator AlpA